MKRSSSEEFKAHTSIRKFERGPTQSPLAVSSLAVRLKILWRGGPPLLSPKLEINSVESGRGDGWLEPRGIITSTRHARFCCCRTERALRFRSTQANGHTWLAFVRARVCTRTPPSSATKKGGSRTRGWKRVKTLNRTGTERKTPANRPPSSHYRETEG